MVKKHLKRKLVLENTERENLYDFFCELKYYMLESNATDGFVSEEGKIYGIGVSRKIDKDSSEEKYIRAYSNDKTKTANMIEFLADHEVTPVSLEYILADIDDNCSS